MRVADYRWIANAAALGAAGWLQDDGDIASRQSRIVHLDDEAIVFEGVQERRDLCGDDVTSRTHTLRRTMHRWNAAAPVKATVACSAEWDVFLRRHPCYTAASVRDFLNQTSLVVLPTSMGGGDIDDLIARFCGPKTPAVIPASAANRLLSLADAFQSSNAMFETDTFKLLAGGRTGNSYDTLSSDHIEYKAWLHDSSGNSNSAIYDWYWQQWDASDNPYTIQWYGTLDIDIYKPGGVTSWLDQCNFIGALIEWRCTNSWQDTDVGTSGSNSVSGFTPLSLGKQSDGHFTWSGQMTSAQHQQIAAICGNHSVSHGVREVYAELVGITFFGVFAPLAATAGLLP